MAVDLKGREVVVAVCGGIAAYKVCHVVSSLVQSGAGVTVAMTRSARRLVGPATFRALSGRRVLTSIWHTDSPHEVEHIAVSGNADLMIVAPTTANMIGKLAHGLADDVVSILAMCSKSPLLLAPAMNDRMWGSPIVQSNLKLLEVLSPVVVGPEEGWLACRSAGAGRMADPQRIVDTAVEILTSVRPAGVAGS